METADGKLARLIYAYNDRYMLTTSVRNDGYSAFGTSNPRATFFSAALAIDGVNNPAGFVDELEGGRSGHPRAFLTVLGEGSETILHAHQGGGVRLQLGKHFPS